MGKWWWWWGGAGEGERIRRCKGRVLALKEEAHIPRVWLPNEDAPGLAMSRAFGDFALKHYGIIALPFSPSALLLLTIVLLFSPLMG